MEASDDAKKVLVITKKGYGKITPLSEYRKSKRGGKGVKTLNVTEKNGELIGLKLVDAETEDLIITTNQGMIIRLSIEQISQTGRATQGVRLINLRDEQEVSSVTVIPRDNEDEEQETTEIEQQSKTNPEGQE